MSPRSSIALLLAAVILGCGPEANGLPSESPGTDDRAIHIADAYGAPLPAFIRSGALGGLSLEVMVEDASGTLHGLDPRGDRRATWGSTNPGVADVDDRAGPVTVYLNRNGEARIIAHLDGLRDTITVQIAQVAVGARVDADTVVTVTADARNLSGAAGTYHAFRYRAVLVDSNGFAVSGTAPMQFDAGADPLFDVALEPRGDTVSVSGIRAGTGTLIARLGEVTHTVPVQVAEAYGVVRLIETPSGAMRTLPDTVRIPAGAAVVFQNETRRFVMIDSYGTQQINWRVGVLPPNGRQAQFFTAPGFHSFTWNGGEGVVIVGP
jgi:hypothetical protein